jgi:RHS repeat-associated protein
VSRLRAFTAAFVAFCLVTGLTAGLPPAGVAAAPSSGQPPERSVPVKSLASKVSPLPAMPKHAGRPVVWPSAASTVVSLPVVSGRQAAASASVGGLPVTLSPVPVNEVTGVLPSSPLAVRVEVLDRAAANRAGVPLALRLSRADGGSSPAKVNVRLDYNGFRDAYGGAWASRLELRQLPECGLSAIPSDTARDGACAGIDLKTTNDFRAGVLSADVDLAAPLKSLSASSGTSVVVLSSSGTAQGIGTFTKTDMKPTYAWNAGTNAGNFTFSYPMATPPVPGGLAPKLSLDYSSQAVDGQTASENVQSGSVGEGWSLTGGGFIEATYRPCAQDNSSDHPATWNNPTGDPCWRYENYQLSWSGSSGELVPTATAGVWKIGDDEGARVEYVTNIPNVAPHWKITTADGTQWFFGRQRLPGWFAGTRETGSVLTQEVFANHSGEPCFHPSGYTYSHCTMAYRWNLDYVVDVNGNSMSYWYTRFGNLAGSNNSGAAVFPYDRDAVLARIEYGTRAGNETNVTAPAMVEFTNSDRCVTNCDDHANWFDTPWDLKCDAAPCNANLTPSYWTDRRLSKVATKVWTGTPGTFKTVDEWALGHSFTGGTDVPVLWLDSVTHTGFDANGNSQTMPSLTTHGFTARNRADYDPNANMADPIKTRIDYIDTETGGRIGVSYLPRDEPACTWWSGKQQSEWPNYNHNASRCFQQFVTNRSGSSGWSWWHKFIVDKVTETDLVGGSPPVETSYSYSMEGAGSPSGHPLVLWSYSSNPWGTVKKSMSTWRGYPTVVTSIGPAGGVQTRTKRLYYRGLDRDTGLDANQGEEFWRRATVTDSQGTTVDDHQAMAGRIREETLYNGPNEADAISRTIHNFVSTSTAGGTLPTWQTPPERYAYQTRETSTKKLTKVIADGSWRVTEVASTYDSYGTLASTNDRGDIVNDSLADNICTRYEYTRNVTPNLLLRTGTGVGAMGAASSGQMMSQNWSAYDIVFSPGDFTGDGKPDVIARNPSDANLYLWAGNGAGGFSSGPTLIGTGGWTAANIDIIFSPGDFNGDGKSDLIARQSDGNLYFYPGNGNGTLNQAGGSRIGLGGWTSAVDRIFSVGDFTGDGKSDVLARRTDGSLYLFPGNGDGTLNQAAWTVVSAGWTGYDQFFGKGDFDGDGKADILVRDPTTTQLTLRKGNGTGGIVAGAVWLGGGWTAQTSMMLGDFNGDGKPDVVSRDDPAWITGAAQRVSAVNADCGTTPVLPDTFVSDVRTFYDNEPFGRAPVRGLTTRTETVKSFTGSTPSGFVVTTADYDRYGREIWSKDPLGYQTSTTYTHDAAGLLSATKVTNPALHETTVTVEPTRGLPLTVSDPNNKVTTGVYDPLGRLTKVWLPGRPTNQTPNMEYAYSVTKSSAPYIASKTLGPNGNQITSYDILDGLLRPRQTQAVTEDGKRTITDTAYDTRGLAAKKSVFYNNASAPASTLATFTDAAIDSQIRNVYDAAGRKTVEQMYKDDSFQFQTQTVYGGDRTGVIPPSGGTPTQDVFDPRDRLVEKRQFSGSPFTGAYATTTYGYDNAGRMTSMKDPANNTWTYQYDLLGRKKKTTDPDAGDTVNTYDDAGNIITTTDSRNQTLFFEYDKLGRKTKERDTNATGTLLAQWTYDDYFKGQLGTTIRYVGADQYKTRITDRDDGYRPKHTEVEIPNATLNGSLATTYTWDSTYKPNGAPATTVLPAIGGLPAETLTNGYDDNGFAQSISGSWTAGSQMYLADTFYAHDGLVTGQVLGETGKRVKLEKTLDPATRRLSKLWIYTERPSNPDSFVLPYDYTYGYDQAGNVTSVESNFNATPDQKECFRYDYLQRLTEAWTQTNGGCTTAQRTGADPYWQQWSFDAVGNRLTQVDKGAVLGDTTWTYTVGAAGAVKPHQLKSITGTGPKAGAARTFGYDSAGNTITATTPTGAAQTLTWDKEGRAATVAEGSTTSNYLYDADGKRLIVRTSSKTTLYLPDGSEVELPSVGAASGTRYYGDFAVRTVTGLRWALNNHQSTAIVQIDAATLATSRRRSKPYGEDRSTTPAGWAGTKGYVGGTKDISSYTHLGARDYDPTTGRFISVDPIMDQTDPDQWNPYAYSRNSPVTFSDPAGTHFTCGNDDPFGNGECPPTPLPPGEPDEDRGGQPGSGSQTAGRGGHNTGGNGNKNSGGGTDGCSGGDRQTGACLPGNGGDGTGGPRLMGTPTSPDNARPSGDGTRSTQFCGIARMAIFLVSVGGDFCFGSTSGNGDFVTSTLYWDWGFAGGNPVQKPQNPEAPSTQGKLKRLGFGAFGGFGLKTTDNDPHNLTGRGSTDEGIISPGIGGGVDHTTYRNGGSSETVFAGVGDYYAANTGINTRTCFDGFGENYYTCD